MHIFLASSDHLGTLCKTSSKLWACTALGSYGRASARGIEPPDDPAVGFYGVAVSSKRVTPVLGVVPFLPMLFGKTQLGQHRRGRFGHV